jgi:4-amino-4-deoxy-L-arabinose transferase-like glycosyltransferase
MSGTHSQQNLKKWYYLAAALLVLLGFGIRVSFMLAEIYHIDEFITMLAATMVAQRGLPILPSGLFYDHGLLFSMISGFFVALLDFREEVVRWPSVLVSVITIAVYFTTARKLFGSTPAGLLAAALVTFDGLSIAWGARARMYSLAHLFVLLTLTFLITSTLKTPTSKGRYLTMFFVIGALLSHTVSFLILPPLAIALLLFTLVYKGAWLRQPRVWLEAIVAATLILATLLVVAQGQISSTVSLQDPNAAAEAPPGAGFLQGFLAPGVEIERFDDLSGFFIQPDYRWLLALIGLSLLFSLVRVTRRQTTFVDIVILFLSLFGLLVLLEQGGLFSTNWQKTRYLFIIAMPAFFLLGAVSLTRLLNGLFTLITLAIRAMLSPEFAARSRGDAWGRMAPLVASVAGVVIILAFWGADAWDTAHAQGTGNYHTAFAYVNEHKQPGDLIMTVHPSAAYLYTGQSDFYANQVSAKVIFDEANATVDRYIGKPLVATVDKFNDVLAGNHRVWFVVDEQRLYYRYDTFFTQQIFAQMDHVFDTGGVLVFVSKPYPVPIQAEPQMTHSSNFNNMIYLNGYTLDPGNLSPTGSLPLALFWQPATNTPPLTDPPKIFVQLRNRHGETIAQADHFLYEGMLTLSQWQALYNSGEWLRDMAHLQLPLPLAADDGPFQIYVGIYNPVTFERVPLLNDTSGENAAVLALPGLE